MQEHEAGSEDTAQCVCRAKCKPGHVAGADSGPGGRGVNLCVLVCVGHAAHWDDRE